jgi:PRTRC genetic system protein B
MEGLGQAMPVEILPERVLVRTREVIVWWNEPQRRRMFFSDRGGDAALKRMNGRMYPHPALLFKVAGSRLWVRALAKDECPKAETKLSMAPYWNCSDDGTVCLGSMRIPREKSVAQIEAWEQSFFRSEFTHAGGVRRHTRYRGGFLAMWQSLEGTKTFPSSYLVRLKESLADFASEKKSGHRHVQHNE